MYSGSFRNTNKTSFIPFCCIFGWTRLSVVYLIAMFFQRPLPFIAFNFHQKYRLRAEAFVPIVEKNAAFRTHNGYHKEII